MGSVGKIAVGAAGLIAALAAVLGVRTALYEPPAASDYSDVSLAAAPVIDNDRAARHLSEAVRFKTISHQNSADNQLAEWDRFHSWLQQTYPAAHAAMQRETVAGHTLIYNWAGSDPARKPMILMAHQDVVPAGAEGDWKHPPFDGTIAERRRLGPWLRRRQGLVDCHLRRHRGAGGFRLPPCPHGHRGERSQ